MSVQSYQTKAKSSPKMNPKQEDKEYVPAEMAGVPEEYGSEFFSDLVKQAEAEYLLAYEHQSGKIKKNLDRLKVYNNQKRDESAVGDPLLFTVHQTVTASLYNDQLMVDFLGREEGDEETGENLNDLARFDYDLMGKAELDYYWIWDAGFFGRGLVRMYEFDRNERLMCPIPELLDPMTFLRDPDAVSVNGDIRGRGSMGFGGRELKIPRYQITDKNGFFNFDVLDGSTPIKSLLKDAEDYRNEAQGRSQMKDKSDEALGDNQKIPVLEWRTIYKGKKCIVWLANGRSRPIKYVEIGDADEVTWDIVDRPFYPHSHDWDGTSIPDLVEDKQRQRAVMMNLGIQAVKGDLYPMYVFDEARIKNKSDLTNFGFNKFVPVEGGGDVRAAVAPMNKASPRLDLVNFILETLDISAQRATATPEMQQGSVSDEKRTLGELNLVASKVDTRYSLTAKVFGWSEKMFWNRWYQLYKEHFKDGIDEKVVRLSGSYGVKWRPLTRENIIMRVDPDIKIESRNISENKKLKDRILLNAYGANVLADPTARRRYLMKKLGKLNGLDRDDIERLYPPTIDELVAEKENDFLDKNELVQVSVSDDDMEHMEVHAKAAETKAKAAHIRAHMDSMIIKRQQPELFNQAQTNASESRMPQDAGAPAPQGGNPLNNTRMLNQQPSDTASQTVPLR